MKDRVKQLEKFVGERSQ